MEANDIAGKAHDLAVRLENEGRRDDAHVVRQMADMLSMKIPKATDVRIRKPQDSERWPDSLTTAQIEELIDAKCGCQGKYDCDCISVFNQTRSQAWYDHNTAGRDAEPTGPRF